MHVLIRTAGLTSVIGLSLLLTAACSKSLQNTGMDGDKPAGTKVKTSTATAPAVTRPSTSDTPAASSMPDSSFAASPTYPSLSSVEPGDALTTSKSGEQVIAPSDIVIAKADASDAARRRAEDLQREALATAAAGLEDVFFAFDSWQRTADAKQALLLDAEWMKSNVDKPILIEGHCDERGTLAYNLVLGEKRAKAAQKYLQELGVTSTRLSVVSYGKERPFCKDRDEGCYQKNRRSHIVLRGK